MRCAYHADRESVGACVECGRFVCADCKATLGGKIYCTPCADKKFVLKSPDSFSPSSQIPVAKQFSPIIKQTTGNVVKSENKIGSSRENPPKKKGKFRGGLIALIVILILIGGGGLFSYIVTNLWHPNEKNVSPAAGFQGNPVSSPSNSFRLPPELQNIVLPASFDIPAPSATPATHIFPLSQTDQKITNLDLPVEATSTKRVNSSSATTISLNNGAELRIPAGSVSAEGNVALKKFTINGPEAKCTAVYRIETDNITLKSMPTLVLPFDAQSIPKNFPDARVKVGLLKPGEGWSEVPAQIDMAGGKASVQVPHFSVTDWFITWPDVFITEIANKTKVILTVPYYTQGWSRWCWAASTQMMLKYYGKRTEIWKIAEDFMAPYDEGLSSWSFAKGDYGNYFKNKELRNIEQSRLGWTDPTELTGYLMYQVRNGRPVWLGLPSVGHAIVVVGFDENKIYFHDPSGATLEFVNGPAKFDKQHLNPASLTWKEWFTGAILGSPLKLLTSTFGFQTLVVMDTAPVSTPAVTMTVDNMDIVFRIPQFSGLSSQFENSFHWDGSKTNGQCFEGVHRALYGLPDNNPGNSDILNKFVITLANSTTQNVTGATIQLLLDDKLLVEKRDIQLNAQTSNIQIDLMEKNPYSLLKNLLTPGPHQFRLTLRSGSVEMDSIAIPFASGPAKPADFKGERIDNAVRLSWTANPEVSNNLGHIEYVIWKDSKNIATTANLTWEEKLSPGDTDPHFYNIEAIDTTHSSQANGWFTSVLSDKLILKPSSSPTPAVKLGGRIYLGASPYQKQSELTRGLFMINPADGKYQSVSPRAIDGISISPDGSKLAAGMLQETGGDPQLAIFDCKDPAFKLLRSVFEVRPGKGPDQLTNPTWSKDSLTLAMRRASDLHLYQYSTDKTKDKTSFWAIRPGLQRITDWLLSGFPETASIYWMTL